MPFEQLHDVVTVMNTQCKEYLTGYYLKQFNVKFAKLAFIAVQARYNCSKDIILTIIHYWLHQSPENRFSF